MLLHIAERHCLEEFADTGTAAVGTLVVEALDQYAPLSSKCPHLDPKVPKNLRRDGSRSAHYRPVIDPQLSERETREKGEARGRKR